MSTQADIWANEYNTSPEWLDRAIEACRRAGVDPIYIRRRYLEQQGTELNKKVDEAMRLVLAEAAKARQADVTRAIKRAQA
jgi:CO/xanthine dehydrogenase Mo-binding subunit